MTNYTTLNSNLKRGILNFFRKNFKKVQPSCYEVYL